eukprot:3230833-Amphidinium_carterae.1
MWFCGILVAAQLDLRKLKAEEHVKPKDIKVELGCCGNIIGEHPPKGPSKFRLQLTEAERWLVPWVD